MREDLSESLWIWIIVHYFMFAFKLLTNISLPKTGFQDHVKKVSYVENKSNFLNSKLVF